MFPHLVTCLHIISTTKGMVAKTAKIMFQFNSIQSLSCVWLFAISWTAACQASLSITNSRSLPKLMSIELVMPSNHLILCHPLLLPPSIFPSIRVFSNEFFASGGQSFGVSASTSVLSMNTQGWSSLGWKFNWLQFLKSDIYPSLILDRCVQFSLNSF